MPHLFSLSTISPATRDRKTNCRDPQVESIASSSVSSAQPSRISLKANAIAWMPSCMCRGMISALMPSDANRSKIICADLTWSSSSLHSPSLSSLQRAYICFWVTSVSGFRAKTRDQILEGNQYGVQKTGKLIQHTFAAESCLCSLTKFLMSSLIEIST